MAKTKTCARCQAEFTGRKTYCADCLDDAKRAKLWASGVVWRFIKRGDIPSPKGLMCVDCGKPASDYDHRDYSKPLEIEPVCRSCNLKRGPGKYYLTDKPLRNYAAWPSLL